MSDEQPTTVYIALSDFTHLGRRYRSGEPVDSARMRSDVIDGLVKNGRMAGTVLSPVPDQSPDPEGTQAQPDPEGTPTEPNTEKPARKKKPDAG